MQLCFTTYVVFNMKSPQMMQNFTTLTQHDAQEDSWKTRFKDLLQGMRTKSTTLLREDTWSTKRRRSQRHDPQWPRKQTCHGNIRDHHSQERDGRRKKKETSSRQQKQDKRKQIDKKQGKKNLSSKKETKRSLENQRKNWSSKWEIESNQTTNR